MHSFSLRTQKHTQLVDITGSVQSAVAGLGVRKGAVTVFIPHTTAGVTINENADPDVVSDLVEALEKIVPWKADYKHIEGNAAAHVKASFMGSSVQVIVEEGLLRLGTWQAIYFCEFDGPRSRDVWIQLTPASD
jgi:secondary thiamine-phosphate synthase enzyme